jgi:hypothetical protein
MGGGIRRRQNVPSPARALLLTLTGGPIARPRLASEGNSGMHRRSREEGEMSVIATTVATRK